jgi:hypothetical protein
MYAEKFKIDVVKLMKRWDCSTVAHIFMQTENLMWYVSVYHRGGCFPELSDRHLYQESAKFFFFSYILDKGEHSIWKDWTLNISYLVFMLEFMYFDFIWKVYAFLLK